MPIVQGLKLSEIPQVSSIQSSDLLLLEANGLSRSIELGVITSGLAVGISGDVSGVISAVFDTIISGITSDIAYISGIVNTNTTDINVISGLLSDVDSLSVAYDPINYIESTSTISGHYEGIDNALAFLSGQISGSGSGIPSGITIENEIYERVLVTTGIVTAGKFAILCPPVSPGGVRLWPQGGGQQINLANALAGETADFEVVSSEIKINSNSSPTSALSNAFLNGDILNIVYEKAVN